MVVLQIFFFPKEKKKKKKNLLVLALIDAVLLHDFSDLGKVLLLPVFGGLPQWAVVGE